MAEATDVASLLATAEVQTSDAEKNLDALSSKFDQTAKHVSEVGENLKGTKQALDSTGTSARAVSKDFENFTNTGSRGIQSLRATTTSFFRELTSQIPGISTVANGMSRDFLRASSQIGAETDRLKGKLQQLAEAESKIGQSTRNKTSDLLTNLRQNVPTTGAVDTDLIRKYRDAATEAEKLALVQERFGTKAKEATQAVAGELDKAANSFTKIERNATQALSAIDAKAVETKAELAALNESSAAGFAAMSGGALIALASIAALGAGVVAAALYTSSMGDEIYRVSQKTKFTTETLSVLRAEAKEAGNNFNEFSTALPRFEKNLAAAAEGNKKLAATFKEVVGQNFAQLNPEAAFKQFLVGFSQIEDGEKRAEIAIQLFGKSGANLIPTFDRIGAGFEEVAAHARALGQVMGRDAVEAAHNFEVRLRDAKLGLEGFLITVGSAALPAITALLDLIVKLAPALLAGVAAFGVVKLAMLGMTVVSGGLEAALFGLGKAWFALNSAMGATGWIGAGVALLVFLSQLGSSEREVNIISKESIQLSQQRVQQSQAELSAAQALSATTQQERASREALIAVKKEELRVNQELAAAQEMAIRDALIKALRNQKQAEDELIEATKKGELGDLAYNKTRAQLNDETDKARKVTLEAVTAYEQSGAAQGKSREQTISQMKALVSQSTAASNSSGIMNILTVAINADAAAQGHLAGATNVATDAIAAQIVKLQEQQRALAQAGQWRDLTIRNSMTQIAENFSGPDAVKELNRQLAPVKRIAPNGETFTAPSDLDIARRRSLEVNNAMSKMGDVMNPPTGGGGGGGKGGAAAAKADLNALLEMLKIIEQAEKRSYQIRLGDEKYFYETGRKNLQDYVNAQIALENEAYVTSMSVADRELRDVEQSKVTGKAREVALAKANDKITEITEKFHANLNNITRDGERERLAIESAAWDRKMGLNQLVAAGQEEIWKRLADRGTATFEAAYKVIEGRQRELLVATLAHNKELLAGFLFKGGNPDSEKYKQFFSDIEKAEQELENFDKKTLLDIQDNHLKDADRTRQWADDIRGIYDSILDSERASEAARLQLLQQSGTQHQALRKKQLDFDLQTEDLESARRVRALEEERQTVEQSLTNAQYKADKLAAINAQIEQEEDASQQRRQALTDKYYQEQRQRLKAQADQIVGVFEKAINGLKTDGWRGFFKSLLSDLDNFLEAAALKVLKAEVFKLLAHINNVPAGSGAKGLPTDPGMSGSKASGAGGVLNTILGALGIHLNGNSQQPPGQVANTTAISVNTSKIDLNNVSTNANTQALHQLSDSLRRNAIDPTNQTRPRRVTVGGGDSANGEFSFPDSSIFAIHEAGHDMTGAIKGAGNASTQGVITSGKAQAGAISAMGQGLISTLMQIVSIMANNNSRGSFWSGLLMAVGTGAINGAFGALTSGGGKVDLGGGSTYTPGGTGDTRPRTVGHAMGGMVQAITGGHLIKAGEAGYDELILSMDPKYKDRTQALMTDFIGRTGITPAFASGGYALAGSSFIPPVPTATRSISGSPPIIQHHHYNFNIHAKDAESVRQSEHQIQRKLYGAVRNGAQHTN